MTERTTKMVLDSMRALAERLAVVAFRSGHESGDVGHHEADDIDLEFLWVDYWEGIYRPTFLGAYFALSESLRRDKSVRRLPDSGENWFMDAIEKLEKKGSRRLPAEPKAPLTFFDGTRNVAAKVPRNLTQRIRAERPKVPRTRATMPSGEVDVRGLPGLAIGDGLEAAFALFGKPAHRNDFDSMEFPIWPEVGLRLGVCKPGYIVVSITAFWDKKAFSRETSGALAKKFKPSPFLARNKIGAGASAKTILAAYGKPTFDNQMKEDGRIVRSINYGDLRFELSNDSATFVAINA